MLKNLGKCNINIYVLLIFIIIFISNICTHLTNDFFVFWEWAKNVRYTGDSGLSALSSSWEIKGLFARFFYLQLYDITNFVKPGGLSMGSMIIYKFIGLIELNTFLWISCLFIPKELANSFSEKLNLFFVVGICVMATTYISHFQPEFIAIYVLISSLCFYLNGNIIAKIIGGVIFTIVFFLKTPLALMGGSVFFSALIIKKTDFYNELNEFIPYVIGWLISFGVSILILFKKIPIEFSDIIDSSYYQYTLLHHPNEVLYAIKRLFLDFLVYCWYIPSILGGAALACIYFKSSIRDHEWRDFINELMIWIFPIVFIVLSNQFFPYHYMILVYPAIISIVATKKLLIKAFDRKWQIIIFTVLIILGIIGFIFNFSFLNNNTLWRLLSLLVLCIVFITRQQIRYIRFVALCCVFIYSTALSGYSHKTIGENRAYDDWYSGSEYVNSKLGDPEDTVLYLDGGMGAFIFNNKSYLRYSYPLPIQRIDEENSKFINRKAFIETKDKILCYNNKYVILNREWFFKYPHTEISNKLEAEYQIVDTINYISFPYDLFSPVINGHFYLLRRK